MSRLAAFLGIASEGARETACMRFRLDGKCPDTCEYKHGPYCERRVDDPLPRFTKQTKGAKP